MSVIPEFLGILEKFDEPLDKDNALLDSAFDEFFKKNKEYINQPDANGVTLLMQVAEHKYVYGFKKCLNAGADPNASGFKKYPNAGADPNASTTGGFSVLPLFPVLPHHILTEEEEKRSRGFSVLSHVLMDCTWLKVDDDECIEVKQKMLVILKENDKFDINFSKLDDDDRLICLQQVEEYDDFLEVFFPKRTTFGILKRYQAALFKYSGRGDEPPLNAALVAKDEASAMVLLDGGNNPDAVDTDGNNALHIAAKDCEIALFNLILSKISDINAENNNGDTALMLAAYCKQLKLVKRLMEEENINVNVQGGFLLYTALHNAVENNSPAIVSQLLTDSRTDITLKSKFKKTALDIAVKDNNAVIVKLFLGHMDHNDVNKFGKYGTILMVAVQDNKFDVVRALLKDQRIDVNKQSEGTNRWTALHWAVSQKLPVIVQLLCLDKRIKLDIKGFKGTPLQYAEWLNDNRTDRTDIIAILKQAILEKAASPATKAASSATKAARLKF